MPVSWIYIIAVILPLAARLLVLDSGIVLNWLWYNQYTEWFYALQNLSVHPQYLEYFGGWTLPIFTAAVVGYWTTEAKDGADNIPAQFLLLPLVYVPFVIAGNVLRERFFDLSMLYVYPLVVVSAGYLYIFPWLLFIWVFIRLRLIVEE